MGTCFVNRNTSCAIWLQRSAKWHSSQIYTEWANHYLEKCQKKRMILDLPKDMQEWQFLVEVIESVTGLQIPDIKWKPKSGIEAIDNIGACINFVESLGVTVDGVTAKDICEGHLKSILGLFFSLSRYKQQQKALEAANRQARGSPNLSAIPTPVQHQHSLERMNSKLPSPLRSAIPTGAPASPAHCTGFGAARSAIPSITHSPLVDGSPSGLRRPSNTQHNKSILPSAPIITNTGIASSNGSTPTKNSGLRTPSSRLQAPQAVSGKNYSEKHDGKRGKSNDSLTAKLIAEQQAQEGSGSRMLKLRFFGGGKEKRADSAKGTAKASTGKCGPNEVSNKRQSTSSSGVSSGHSGSLDRSTGSIADSAISSSKISSKTSTTTATTSSSGSINTSASSGKKKSLSSAAKITSNNPLLVSDGAKAQKTHGSVQTSPQMLRKPATNNKMVQAKKIKGSEEGSTYLEPTSASSPANKICSSNNSKAVKSGNTLKLLDQRASPVGALSVAKELFSSTEAPVSINNNTLSVDSKPVLAVKGIAAATANNGSKVLSPSKVNMSQQQSGIIKPSSLLPKSASKSTGLKQSTSASEKLAQAKLSATNKTANNSSPAVGVVSPMTHHKNLSNQQQKVKEQLAKEGDQSDSNTSTTSGSRDSDSVSVIFNPSAANISSDERHKQQSPSQGLSKPPPVPRKNQPEKTKPLIPNRTTSSRLETTFDCTDDGKVVTVDSTASDSHSSSNAEDSNESIKPMKPLVPRGSPYAYLKALPSQGAHKILSGQRNHMTISRPIETTLEVNSSTNEEISDLTGEDQQQTIITSAAGEVSAAGYVSDSDALTATLSGPLADLSTADLTNGYMSEGGISLYARKMQARFKEGLEAVRDSMRRQRNEFNDSFEDSSSLSSGLSENIDDISTDDLTGSSQSDHQMAAAAYGKYGDFTTGTTGKSIKQQQQHLFNVAVAQQKQQRNRSGASQQPQQQQQENNNRTSSSSLQERKAIEQENIGQLLQRCRTSQRGMATFSSGGCLSAPANNGRVRYNNHIVQQNAFYQNTMDRAFSGTKLQLSRDGQTLFEGAIEDRMMIGEERRPGSAQSQPVIEQSPPMASGYHSLDRKRHLINYYSATAAPNGCGDTYNHSHLLKTHNIGRIGAAERNEALAALVSPRRVPPNNGSFSLPVSHEGPLSPEETAWNRHTIANSPRKTSDGTIYANLQLHRLTNGAAVSAGNSPSRSNASRSSAGRPVDPSPYLTSVLSKVGSASGQLADIEMIHNGSSLSLASTSSSIYSTAEEKYQAEIRKLQREMDAYREKVTALTAQQTTYTNMIQAFERALQSMVRRVEGLQVVSQQKEDEVSHLRGEIELLRELSVNAGINLQQVLAQKQQSPAVQRRHTFCDQQQQGNLVRQPSVESVNSQRSSLSTSSKGSKADKASVNSFGKKAKNSWIRSSITRAFGKGKKNVNNSQHKNGLMSDVEESCSYASPVHSARHSSTTSADDRHRLKSISGSASGIDELVETNCVTDLKRQLEDKDTTLTDVRLEALTTAHQVDQLKDAVHRLRSENVSLKQDNSRLQKIVLSGSRSGSQSSLPLLIDESNEAALVVEERREFVPVSTALASDPILSSTEKKSASERVKVCVSLDMSGQLTVDAGTEDTDILIGSISAPSMTTTWSGLDDDVIRLFNRYLNEIDCGGNLNLNGNESVIGYQLGRSIVRDRNNPLQPKTGPFQSLISSSSSSSSSTNSATDTQKQQQQQHFSPIRIMLRGVAQKAVDALALESPIPRSMLERWTGQLVENRRVILSGACALGKSFLARKLAEYLVLKAGKRSDDGRSIEVLCLPEEDRENNGTKAVEEIRDRLNLLVSKYRSGEGPVVVLIDNLHNVSVLSEFFSCLDNLRPIEAPCIIGTTNQSSTQPITNLQVHHYFRVNMLSNHMVKGYLSRYLKRRLIHEQCRGQNKKHFPHHFNKVIEFLPRVWTALNIFIETVNSPDVSIGPRLFLSCPIGMTESRDWFIELWNCKIIPYLIEATREGLNLFGKRGSLEDPTDVVCEDWPWIEGQPGEEVLKRLSIKDLSLHGDGLSPVKSKFDPLEALIRLQSNRSTVSDQQNLI